MVTPMEQTIDFRTDPTASETCEGFLRPWVPAPQRREFTFTRCSGCGEWQVEMTIALQAGPTAFFVKAPKHWKEAEVVEQAILSAWEREDAEFRIARKVEEGTERAIARQVEQDLGLASMARFQIRHEASDAASAAREEAGLPEPF